MHQQYVGVSPSLECSENNVSQLCKSSKFGFGVPNCSREEWPLGDDRIMVLSTGNSFSKAEKSICVAYHSKRHTITVYSENPRQHGQRINTLERTRRPVKADSYRRRFDMLEPNKGREHQNARYYKRRYSQIQGDGRKRGNYRVQSNIVPLSSGPNPSGKIGIGWNFPIGHTVISVMALLWCRYRKYRKGSRA